MKLENALGNHVEVVLFCEVVEASGFYISLQNEHVVLMVNEALKNLTKVGGSK